MAVTTALIESVSGYISGTDYTAGDFTTYQSVAELQLTAESTTISGDLKDLAVAYLISHRIFLKQSGKNDAKSEGIGGGEYTYSRDPVKTTSTFLEEYYKIIKLGSKQIQPSHGVQRLDAVASSAFRISKQRMPVTPYLDDRLEIP